MSMAIMHSYTGHLASWTCWHSAGKQNDIWCSPQDFVDAMLSAHTFVCRMKDIQVFQTLWSPMAASRCAKPSVLTMIWTAVWVTWMALHEDQLLCTALCQSITWDMQQEAWSVIHTSFTPVLLTMQAGIECAMSADRPLTLHCIGCYSQRKGTLCIVASHFVQHPSRDSLWSRRRESSWPPCSCLAGQLCLQTWQATAFLCSCLTTFQILQQCRNALAPP